MANETDPWDIAKKQKKKKEDKGVFIPPSTGKEEKKTDKQKKIEKQMTKDMYEKHMESKRKKDWRNPISKKPKKGDKPTPWMELKGGGRLKSRYIGGGRTQHD